MIEILFSDLSEEKQSEILAALGDNGNYDVIPIAMLIEPGEDDSYPARRFLDEAFFTVSRDGSPEQVSFSDLTVDEQVRLLSSLQRKDTEKLCLFLADTIRSLGEQHHLNHSAKYDGSLNNLVRELTGILTEGIGDRLKQVVLYGSYARGDYTNESDINFLVVIDEDSETEIRHCRQKLNSKISDLELRTDLVISVKMISEQFCLKYRNTARLSRIFEEGIVVWNRNGDDSFG